MLDLTIKDLPVVFLSLDEANADDNYQWLLKSRPDAQRVSGILGSDAAHKACADAVRGPWICIVDADTRPHNSFWSQHWQLDHGQAGPDSVLSFTSENTINSLCYGNGGIKIWPRHIIENMRTHEAADDAAAAVDFCWALDYVLMPGVWARTDPAATAQQAWRAGFREGVKFTMLSGRECKDPDLWQRRVEAVNLRRLCTWQQLGMDHPRGVWAILGARQGFYQALLTDWPTAQVRDFAVLNQLAQTIPSTAQQALAQITELGQAVLDAVSIDITPEPLPAQASRWVRRFYPQETRTEPRRLRT